MKNFMRISLLFLIGGALLQCSDPVENFEPVQVQFTFDVSGSDNGRVLGSESPTTLLLSLETSDGSPVLTMEEIGLVKFLDGYMTEPLELQKGSYKITDFLLVSDDSQVLYATPRRGSPMEKAVSTPIPKSFFAAKNSLSTIEMEVVNAAHLTAEDLGYTSFGIDIVNPIRLSVFAKSHSGFEQIPSDVYILNDEDTIGQAYLAAGLGIVSFEGDPDAEYTLIVASEGYNFEKLQFVYNDLMESLDGSALEFTLGPPFTFSVYVPRDNYGDGEHRLELSMYGTNDLYIDWGDGVTTYGEFTHSYPSPTNYHVTITGDLSSIKSFNAFYDISRFYLFDFDALTGLEYLELGLMNGPNSIGLENNVNLEILVLTGLNQLTFLTLPDSHNLTVVDFTGPNKLSAGTINYLVDNIHSNAVEKDIRNGDLSLFTTWYPPYDELIGPPSAESIAKMEELRDDYGWSIEAE